MARESGTHRGRLSSASSDTEGTQHRASSPLVARCCGLMCGVQWRWQARVLSPENGARGVMADNFLEWLEAGPCGFPTERPALSRLMGANVVAVIDGKFFNVQEHPMPLVVLEGLGFEPFETIPEPSVFPLFLHELECTSFGLSGAVRWPATRVNDSNPSFWPPTTLWRYPSGVLDLRLKGWEAWLQAEAKDGVSLSSIIGARELNAYREFVLFRAWAAPQSAEQVISLHKAVGGELKEIVAHCPDAAGQPALREYSAEHTLSGESKRRGVGEHGKDVDRSRAVIELMALAGVIRTRDGLSSWDKAYEAACNERPQWVPSDWSDPAYNLKTNVVRLKGTRWPAFRHFE